MSPHQKLRMADFWGFRFFGLRAASQKLNSITNSVHWAIDKGPQLSGYAPVVFAV